MITGIDHVVILVRDLAAAMDDYGRLGFTVSLGGEHPGGTHNALIAFADGSYLELIAFKEPDQTSEHPWHKALELGEGIVAFALGSSDLEDDAASIGAFGVTVSEIVDGGRTRPDGQQLAWRSAGLGDGPRGMQRPFLIQDVTPRELRVASGRLASHANSAVSILDVALGVTDLESAAREIAALTGASLPTATEDSGARQMTFALPSGTITLLQPTDTTTAVSQAVATRDEHIYAAVFGAMLQGGEPEYDASLAHGANLSFRPV